jgi:hypothetical protein
MKDNYIYLTVKSYIRNFKQGIKNLIKWFPTIWNDRNWDYYFILEILKVKLQTQSDYIRKNGNHTQANRDSEIMNTLVKLTHRFQNAYYETEYFDYCDLEHNFIPNKEGKLYTLTTNVSYDNFTEYFNKYPLQYKKQKRLYPKNDRRAIAHKIATENHNRCRRLLFNMLENKIESFWD